MAALRGGALARGVRSVMPALARGFQSSAPKSLKLQPEANVEVVPVPSARAPPLPTLPAWERCARWAAPEREQRCEGARAVSAVPP